jgi:hypothetical protein
VTGGASAGRPGAGHGIPRGLDRGIGDVPASPGIGAARARPIVSTRAPVVSLTLGRELQRRLNEGAVCADERPGGGLARQGPTICIADGRKPNVLRDVREGCAASAMLRNRTRSGWRSARASARRSPRGRSAGSRRRRRVGARHAAQPDLGTW